MLVLSRYRIMPFAAVDLRLLDPRDGALDGLEAFGETAAAYEAMGNGFTLWEHLPDGDPRPIFCGGALERHAEYATLWSIFGKAAPRLPIYLTRRVRAFVRALPHRRVDTMISPGVHGAAGWAALLGLRHEATLGSYFPDGGAAMIYVREV